MRVAYIRVSTAEQNTARQEIMMQEKNIDRVFMEKASGKDTEGRPQLKAMLDFVREGDTLVIESFSRLARSTRDLLNIIDELQKKNVSFISLKENIDTSTPAGRFMLTVFAGLSQFERECIRQRQLEGIKVARANGTYKGRKPEPVPADFHKVIGIWKTGTITAVQAMTMLKMSKATFYRKVKQYYPELTKA